ncbi:LytTR family DNA-binding domain-containing protein [Pseudomonas syringae pv. actinidiae]|nr:LytTR family DNA-binding domain-containing protein [Pseudomonas syringae pv. actinidiae]
MYQWLSSAKELTNRLQEKSDVLPGINLCHEIGLLNDLIRQAEEEIRQEYGAVTGGVVGQCKGMSKLLFARDIAYCQSGDRKVFLTDAAGRVYHTAKSLKDIENTFPHLIKVNQSTLVNKSHISEIELVDSLGYHIMRLGDNKAFRISRRCLKKVREHFWPELSEDELIPKAS